MLNFCAKNATRISILGGGHFWNIIADDVKSIETDYFLDRNFFSKYLWMRC